MDSGSFEKLVYRYLEGTLKDEEYDQFLNSLKDDDHLARFDQLKDSWTPASNQRSAFNWRRLSYRMVNSENKLSNKKLRIDNYWLSGIAAVLIIGLIISTALLYVKSESMISGYTTIETPRGEKSKIFLPDGTEVWLNTNSSLSYSTLTKQQRKVKLQGEAYFEVKHADNIPFIVSTDRCDIKVLGTEFNVMAYKEFNRNEVTLFKGRVEVETPQQSAILKVGERYYVSDQSEYIEQADLEQTHSWVENRLNFKKIPFEELIMRLENWYDVDILHDRNKVSTIEFTGSFKNEETIWQILDALNVYIPIEYKRIDNRKIELNVK